MALGRVHRLLLRSALVLTCSMAFAARADVRSNDDAQGAPSGAPVRVVTPCDGKADDTAAVQAALAAASRPAIIEQEWGQGAGDLVLLPRGVCRITAPLVIRGTGVTLAGAGIGATTLSIEVGRDRDAITFEADKTGLRDLTVYARDRRRMRDGVRFVGRQFHRIENVSVYYAGRYGVNVERPLNFDLENVFVRGAGEAGLRVDADPEDGTEGTTFRASGLHTLQSVGGGVLVGHVYGATFIGLISEYNGPQVWEARTNYDYNRLVTNDGGKVYEAIAAGRSGAGAGPTGERASIADGEVRWRYVGRFHPEDNYGLKVTGTNPKNARRGSAEVTLIQPYFERNRGWDMALGLDPVHASRVTVIAPEHRNDIDRAEGYGAILADNVRGGGIFGGTFSVLMPRGLAILLTRRARDFTVFSVRGASAANVRYADGGIDEYPGLFVAQEEGGAAQLHGNYIPRAAGTPVGSGTAPPTSGSWARGSVWLNTAPAAGAPAGWVCVSPGTPGRWMPLPGQAQAQRDSTAADLAALRDDLNALLSRLRAAGAIAR